MVTSNVVRVERKTTTPAARRGSVTAANDNQRRGPSNVRNIRRNTNTLDPNPFYDTTAEQFNKRYDPNQRYQNPANSNINRVNRTYAPAVENQPAYQPVRKANTRQKVNHKNKAASKTKKIAARLAATRINVWVMAWSITWYLSFQWWMGLISLAGLGVAGAVYNYLYTVDQTDGGFFLEVTGVFIETVGELAVAVAQQINAIAFELFGISFDPTPIFIAPSAILLVLGLLFHLSIYAIYSVSGIKSLSGDKGWLKILYFTASVVSSVTPLPLTFLWIAYVWKNPK